MTNGINHITLAVNDVEISFNFYTKILGLKPIVKWKNGAYLLAGDTWIALNQDLKVKDAVRPDYSHIAFTCAQSEFIDLKKSILKRGCPEWTENKSEGESLYFYDPDGHKLEIHAGNLESRLREMRNNPWDEFKFYFMHSC
jgi:catechol 2,3-dioxygenase-like lactoylglutathione lyase family enzyme